MTALYELYPKDKNWRSEDCEDLDWQTLHVFHDLVDNDLARAIGWLEEEEGEGGEGETSAEKPGDGEDESGGRALEMRKALTMLEWKRVEERSLRMRSRGWCGLRVRMCASSTAWNKSSTW